MDMQKKRGQVWGFQKGGGGNRTKPSSWSRSKGLKGGGHKLVWSWNAIETQGRGGRDDDLRIGWLKRKAAEGRDY